MRIHQIAVFTTACSAFFMMGSCEGCGAIGDKIFLPFHAGKTKSSHNPSDKSAEDPPQQGSARAHTPHPPSVDLVGNPTQNRAVALSVINRDKEAVRLKTAVKIEQFIAKRWQEIEIAPFVLRWSCKIAAKSCLTLLPGAELQPPLWRGPLGRSQCDGQKMMTKAEPGIYRFVVEGCEKPYRIVGRAFDTRKPSPPPISSLKE